MKRWCVITGILGAMLLMAGCIGTGSTRQVGELAVVNHEMVKGESGSVEVKVTVKNIGPVMVELAEVTVSFYDDQKGFIDSSSDSVMNLGRGESWDFKIACEGARCSQVKSYEIETIASGSSGGP